MGKSTCRIGFVLLTVSVFALLTKGCGEAFDPPDVKKSVTISGVVLNKKTAKPVENALVQIVAPPPVQQSTTTDSTGQYTFSFKIKDAISVAIEASKLEYQTKTKKVSVVPDNTYNDVNIVLESGEAGGGGDDGTGNDPSGPAAIYLANNPPEAISIAATGDNISTKIVFQVQDSLQNYIQGYIQKSQSSKTNYSNSKSFLKDRNSKNKLIPTRGEPKSAKNITAAPNVEGIEVQFSIITGPGGGERLVPVKATTNAEGKVSTTLYSGNKAGIVQLQALIVLPNGQKLKSEPAVITIHGGYPDDSHFTLSATKQNIEAISGNKSTINVILGDKFSNPVKPGTAVYFETTGGIIEGSATTDENGMASVELTVAKPIPNNGVATVTASTVSTDSKKISESFNVIFSTSEAAITSTPTAFTLPAGGTQQVSYTVEDLNGHAMAPGTAIQVAGGPEVQLNGDVKVTLSSGTTSFNFTVQDIDNKANGEKLPITITVTSPSGKRTTYTIRGQAEPPQGTDPQTPSAVVLANSPSSAIRIAETGDNVSTSITFQVIDQEGDPLSAQNPVKVAFKLITSPGGGEYLVPASATTDDQGKVTTRLFSGNKAGPVKVQAQVTRSDGTVIQSSPVLVAIHGGYPDKNHFSISAEKRNFEGYTIDGRKNTITVVLGDKFSNPVKPGTVVYFKTSGGIIQGSATTNENGIASVELISGNPRPTGGLATITATTINANGKRISTTVDVVMSGSKAFISTNPGSGFTVSNGGGITVDYTVKDLNGRPMAAGTQIKVEAGSGIELTGDVNFKLGNFRQAGPGATEFTFSASDADAKNSNPAKVTIKISVTTPSGNVTTYSISGTVN